MFSYQLLIIIALQAGAMAPPIAPTYVADYESIEECLPTVVTIDEPPTQHAIDKQKCWPIAVVGVAHFGVTTAEAVRRHNPHGLGLCMELGPGDHS